MRWTACACAAGMILAATTGSALAQQPQGWGDQAGWVAGNPYIYIDFEDYQKLGDPNSSPADHESKYLSGGYGDWNYSSTPYNGPGPGQTGSVYGQMADGNNNLPRGALSVGYDPSYGGTGSANPTYHFLSAWHNANCWSTYGQYVKPQEAVDNTQSANYGAQAWRYAGYEATGGCSGEPASPRLGLGSIGDGTGAQVGSGAADTHDVFEWNLSFKAADPDTAMRQTIHVGGGTCCGAEGGPFGLLIDLGQDDNNMNIIIKGRQLHDGGGNEHYVYATIAKNIDRAAWHILRSSTEFTGVASYDTGKIWLDGVLIFDSANTATYPAAADIKWLINGTLYNIGDAGNPYGATEQIRMSGEVWNGAIGTQSMDENMVFHDAGDRWYGQQEPNPDGNVDGNGIYFDNIFYEGRNDEWMVGDSDNDGDVDFDDFLSIAIAWGTGVHRYSGDFDGDGDADFDDFLELTLNWTGSAGVVPEPASMALLALVGAVALRRSRTTFRWRRR